MRREGRSEDPLIASLALVVVFAVVAAFGLWHHEMWRDEYQAWLVARDAHSIPELFANLRYEGNPALWHLLLFGLTALTPDPRAMQVLNYLLSVAAVAVISFRAPFPRPWKVLLVFGYYSLFEFTMMSRSYALGFLLVAVACAWFPTRHTRPIRLAVFLALLMNTHVFGFAIAAAIGFVAAADVFLPWFKMPAVSVRLRALFLAIVIAGSVTSLVQVLPEPGNSFPIKKPEAGLDVRRIAEALADVSRSYVPIPAPGLPHFWNTNFMDFLRPPIPGWTPTRLEALLSLALLLVFVWYFRERPLVAAAYLAGTAALLVVKYQTGFGLQRYIGHLFVMLVAAMWMRRASAPYVEELETARQTPAPWRRMAGELTFTVVLACGCAGGLIAWGVDVRQPFSSSQDVVKFLQTEKLDQDEIIAIADHAASPIAAELHRRVYFPQLGRDGSFTIWSSERHDRLDPHDLIRQITAVVARSDRRRAVLVLNTPAVDVLSPIVPTEPTSVVPLSDTLTLRPIFHAPLAIVIGEEYFVYLIETKK